MKTRYVIQYSFDNNVWWDELTCASRKLALIEMDRLTSQDDDSGGWRRIVTKCEFFIVQVKKYLGTEKPRKFIWEELQRWEVDEDSSLDTHDYDLPKHFSTRKRAERAAKKLYKPKYYRIVRCEVVT